MIMCRRHVHMIVVQVLISEIDRPRFVDRYGWIALVRQSAGTVRDSANAPGDSRIFRNDHVYQPVTDYRRIESATFVWNKNRSVGSDLWMTMQSNAATRRRIINRNDRSKRVTAIVAPRAERSRHVLRTIINRVRIQRVLNQRGGAGFRVWTNAHSGMINAAADSPAHRRAPILAIIVTEIS